ncbi:unnamed protein product [Callosobruchus maculatus]|uniref:Anaphase-promoting complex subunit 4 WD40 domain-containing protein n=1 Tax=Callosobruchus maculatus TaxID=64391 RepID=A0A653CCR2_CALMS|nr:unnamed protein product [Callosobruchus maculatus]
MAKYPDRFIPQRSATDFEQSFFILSENTDEKATIEVVPTESGVVLLGKAANNRKNYKDQLRLSIFGTNRQKKVLQFSFRSSRGDTAQQTFKPSSDVWPVKPRKKPLLKSPSIILDLPDIQNHLDYSSPLDWGAAGYIATIYEKEVHFWHPDGKVITETQTFRSVGNCLKWNRHGNLLAFATEGLTRRFSVLDIHSQKDIVTYFHCCVYCQITAMEWSMSNHLITGCSCGYVRTWRMVSDKKSWSHVQMEWAISCIKLSSQEKYCAVVSRNTSVLKLHTWPKMNPHFDLNCQGTDEKISIDWHPWKDCLLAVGQSNCILIWNVNTLTVVGQVSCHYVDAVAFNPLSGELLISAYQSLPDGSTKVHLRVLRNCKKVVDEVIHYNGREPFLYWDSTGTKLAVAGEHESLCIWDFFGSSSNEIKKKHSKRSRLTSDPFETLKLIGPTIR